MAVAFSTTNRTPPSGGSLVSRQLWISRQLEEAQSLRAAGRLAEALEALVSPDEFSADLCAARGAIEFSLGRFQDAALSFSAVAIAKPDDAATHYNLALCLERGGRWDAASEAFERVLRLDSACTEAHLGYGACLLEMNRPEDALENFERAGAERGLALLGKGVAMQKLGRFNEAEKAYAGLLAAEPESEEALSNWIAMSIETHDLERAQALSERLRALSPRSRIALQGLATVALERGDPDAAAFYCGQLLDLTPDCMEAWHNLRIALGQFRFGADAFAMPSGGRV